MLPRNITEEEVMQKLRDFFGVGQQKEFEMQVFYTRSRLLKDIPTNLLIQIFTYLDGMSLIGTISLVSKKFNEISDDDHVWAQQRLGIPPKFMPELTIARKSCFSKW